MNELFKQATAVMEELGEKAKLKAGDIVVVGCPHQTEIYRRLQSRV